MKTRKSAKAPREPSYPETIVLLADLAERGRSTADAVTILADAVAFVCANALAKPPDLSPRIEESLTTFLRANPGRKLS